MLYQYTEGMLPLGVVAWGGTVSSSLNWSSPRPLLYSLEIAEDFKVLHSYAFESRDYQVTPGSPWNYALKLQNDSQPDKDLTFANKGLELGVHPFSLKGAPGMIVAQVIHTTLSVSIMVLSVCITTLLAFLPSPQGRILDSWQLSHNAAAAPPTSPVTSSNPLTRLTLLPFGATDLRIAELPTLAED